ncbi:MAG: enoyl-ACP reductase [Firmicutes bacterium]|nr:enoyl-ACP reductase [Bacillota bacterium]
MLQGKTGIVFGVANHRSLAWFITKALSNAGAKLAITYQDKRFEQKLKKLAEEELPDQPLALLCDIRDDAQIENVYRQLHESYGRLDFIVHSIAFASREDLEGQFIQTSRSGFLLSMEISVYSLLAVVRPALPLMEKGGSIVTLSYLGGQRVVQNYNVMGVAKAALESSVRYLAADLGEKNIRVNALSPGPVNTLSARGIKGFTGFLKHIREKAPMRRNIEGEEIGSAALFLCSDLSRGITGETIYVDAGYHIMGS